MKFKRLLTLTLCLGSVFTLSGCQKASNITKICMPKTVNGLNLYLTANAKGKISNTYIYLNDKSTMKEYAQEVYDKANNGRPNCDVAYFPVYDSENSLKHLFELDKDTKYFKIVYIDEYEIDSGNPSKITGVWVGRDNTDKKKSWINSTNNTGRKFIDGLAKAAQYRVSEMKTYNEKGEVVRKANNDDYKLAHLKYIDKDFTKFEDMFNFIKEEMKNNNLPEFVFNDKNDKIVNYKSVYEYAALFALQNRGLGQPFHDGNVLNNFATSYQKTSSTKVFINNDKAKALYGYTHTVKKDGKSVEETVDPTDTVTRDNLLNALKTAAGIDDSRFEFKLMQHGIGHVDDASSGGSMMKVILWSSIGGAVIIAVITLLIIRRVKTGKKLFDIKRALDADLDPDDPKVINMKKVGKDLKALREKKKLSVEDAAKQMHIPMKFMSQLIEQGEIVLSKGQRKKYINFYNLPSDYFDKAYSVKDK